jgi:hypothetical protein
VKYTCNVSLDNNEDKTYSIEAKSMTDAKAQAEQKARDETGCEVVRVMTFNADFFK